jgi:hypothetical protein
VTTTEDASAKDSTLAVRDTAGGSKNRTIPGAIKALFRRVANLIAARNEDEPKPETRRGRILTTRHFAGRPWV